MSKWQAVELCFQVIFSQPSYHSADSKWICQNCKANKEPTLTKCYEIHMMSERERNITLIGKEKNIVLQDENIIVWKWH